MAATQLQSGNTLLRSSNLIYSPGLSFPAFLPQRPRYAGRSSKGDIWMRSLSSISSNRVLVAITRASGSSDFGGDKDEPPEKQKTSFGYTRKDVILIGLGITVAGVALKSGLEYLGVDPFQAGNVVQIVLVLGLTVGWTLTYVFRVSNKEMTYAQQLRDYEEKVMQKRLESLTEAELEALLEQVEEEKTRLGGAEEVK